MCFLSASCHVFFFPFHGFRKFFHCMPQVLHFPRGVGRCLGEAAFQELDALCFLEDPRVVDFDGVGAAQLGHGKFSVASILPVGRVVVIEDHIFVFDHVSWVQVQIDRGHPHVSSRPFHASCFSYVPFSQLHVGSHDRNFAPVFHVFGDGEAHVDAFFFSFSSLGSFPLVVGTCDAFLPLVSSSLRLPRRLPSSSPFSRAREPRRRAFVAAHRFAYVAMLRRTPTWCDPSDRSIPSDDPSLLSLGNG
mmetsp:Transcript_4105/g.25866  ORF Transcript_4105/g.25866 Transcript_4105/m.25866 type:complete len:247 (+) Transcript_4105:3322-4062(+)